MITAEEALTAPAGVAEGADAATKFHPSLYVVDGGAHNAVTADLGMRRAASEHNRINLVTDRCCPE